MNWRRKSKNGRALSSNCTTESLCARFSVNLTHLSEDALLCLSRSLGLKRVTSTLEGNTTFLFPLIH